MDNNRVRNANTSLVFVISHLLEKKTRRKRMNEYSNKHTREKDILSLFLGQSSANDCITFFSDDNYLEE